MKGEKIFFNYNLVVEAFKRLISLLSYDEEYLKNNEVQKIYETLDTRNDLLNFITRQKNVLARCKDKKSILSEQQQKTLNQLSSELNEIGNKSKRAISKAIYTNREVLSIVSDLVTKNVNAVNYSSRGLKKNTSKFREIPYLAINQKL